MEKNTKTPVEILLVEDDEIDIQNVHRAFGKTSIPVNIHIARNGIEALDKLYAKDKEGRFNLIPQLIVLDINMPMMNGVEFLTHLRATSIFDNTKVLVLTTSDNPKDKLNVFHLNVDGYITKPIQAKELMDFFDNIGWELS